MKALVIYDSKYGNTEKIAKAVAEGIGEDVTVMKAEEADVTNLGFYNLIIAGAPTQGGQYTAAMQQFLNKIPGNALKVKQVAAFDTRLKTKLVKLFGYAAGRIEKKLAEKGGNVVAPAEGFIVKGAKGPLLDGEIERAAAWAKSIIEKLKI
jgi:flavodoxin I